MESGDQGSFSPKDLARGESCGLGGVWLSPDDHHTKSGVRSKEQAFDELRRENFRLRLTCYNYEQMFSKYNNPQDAESSRVYAAESENVALRESLADNQILLKAATETVDHLKDEIVYLEKEVDKLKERNNKDEEAWQIKYDGLYSDYQKLQEKVRAQSALMLARESEFNEKRNDLECCNAKLQIELEKCELSVGRYQQELQRFQDEADELHIKLQRINDEQVHAHNEIRVDLSSDIHKSCEERLQEISSLVSILTKQLVDAGLQPNMTIDITNRQLSNSQLANTEKSKLVCSSTPNLDSENFAPTDGESVWSNRLDCARQLIFDLGNKKLEQDKIIAEMRSSHERSIQTLSGEYAAAKTQLTKEKQYFQDELTRRDEEIKRLNRQINELTNQLESTLEVREQLQSELEQTKEQLDRIKGQNSDLQDHLTKKSEENQRVVQHFKNLFRSTNKLDDSAINCSRNDSALENLAVLLNQSLRTNLSKMESERLFPTHLFDDSTVRHYKDNTEPEDDNSAKCVKHIADTYSPVSELSGPQSLITLHSRTSDILSTNGQIDCSMDHISLNATKNLTTASTSRLGSIVDSPSISTLPNDCGSPIFPEPINETSYEISKPPTAEVKVNDPPISNSKNSVVLLDTLNNHAHSAHDCEGLYEQSNNYSVQHNVSLHKDCLNASNDQNLTPADQVQQAGGSKPQSLSSLRTLYNLIHDLMLQLDNVRFTQHSFVEMINRSLSTAGIDASLHFGSAHKSTSLSTDSDKVLGLSMPFAENNPLQDDSANVSQADATYGGCMETFDNLDVSRGVGDVSSVGMNLTVAELRDGCPLSPVSLKAGHKGHRENNDTSFDPLSKTKHVTTHHIKQLPQFKDEIKNLIGSLTFCEGHNNSMKPSKRNPALNLSEEFHNSIDENRVTPTNMGDLTTVEWEHRDIFERLSLAMSKLRDAIQECSDVGSSFLNADVKDHLSVLFGSQIDLLHQLDNQKLQSSTVFDKCEADNITSKVNELSTQFGVVTPQVNTITFTNQNDEASLSQLYGSAWRRSCDLSRFGVECKNESHIQLKQDYEHLLQSYRELVQQYSGSKNEFSSNEVPWVSIPSDYNKHVSLTSSHLESRCLPQLASNSDNVPVNDGSDSKAGPNAQKSLDDVLEELAKQTTRADELESKCACLSETLLNSVPKAVVEELECVKVDFVHSKKLIETFESERVDAVEKLRTLGLNIESDQMLDLVNGAVSQLIETRDVVVDLKSYCSEIEQNLSDYHSLQANLEVLQSEVKEAHKQVEYHRNELHYAINTLNSLFNVDDSISLKALVDLIMVGFGNQKEQIDLMCDDRRSIMEAISDFTAQTNIPDSLVECFDIVTTQLGAQRDLNNKLEDEKEDVLNLLTAIFPDRLNTESSLIDRVTNVVRLCDDKQQQVDHFQKLCEDSEKALRSALEKCGFLEELVGTLNDQLTASQNNVKSLEISLTEFTNTHVPSETYNTLFERLQNAEKDLIEISSSILQLDHEEMVDKTLITQMSNIPVQKQVATLCSKYIEAIQQLSSLNLNLEQMRLDYNELVIQNKKNTMELEELRNVVSGKDDTIKVAEEARLASEEFNNQLAMQLDDLRKLHAHCVQKCELVDCETSPHKSFGHHDEVRNVAFDAPKMRKYNQLREAAFEIKEKLVSRTDKLQSALEEVARLRSVIQQDKERASVTLREVEDLREQMLLKNKNIRDLEAELKRLRAPAVKSAVGNTHNTESSARTLSELEQPRSCYRRSELTDSTNLQQSGAVIGSTALSLMRFPSTPTISIGHLDQLSLQSVVPQSRCSVDSQSFGDSPLTEDVSYVGCRRCCELEKSLYKFQKIVNRLRKYMDLNISDETCLLIALEQSHTECESSVSVPDKKHHRVKSPSQFINQSRSTSSVNINLVDLRTNIESLNEARLKFNFHADEMNNLCAKIVEQCEKFPKYQYCQHHYDFSSVLKLLKSIISRWESLMLEYDFSEYEAVRTVLDDLYTLLNALSDFDIKTNNSLTCEKENVLLCKQNSTHEAKSDYMVLLSQVDRYRQKYKRLSRELGQVSEDLSQTTDMLAAARSNLGH